MGNLKTGKKKKKSVLLILLFHNKWNWKNFRTASVRKETNITKSTRGLFISALLFGIMGCIHSQRSQILADKLIFPFLKWKQNASYKIKVGSDLLLEE